MYKQRVRERVWVIFFDVLFVNLQPYIFGLSAVKALAQCWYHGINADATQADTRGVNESAITSTFNYTGNIFVCTTCTGLCDFFIIIYFKYIFSLQNFLREKLIVELKI